MIFVGRDGSRVYSASIVGPLYLVSLVIAIVATFLMTQCMGGPPRSSGPETRGEREGLDRMDKREHGAVRGDAR